MKTFSWTEFWKDRIIGTIGVIGTIILVGVVCYDLGVLEGHDQKCGPVMKELRK